MRRPGLFGKLCAGFLFVVTVAFAVNAALTIRAGDASLGRLVETRMMLEVEATLFEVQRYLRGCGQEIRLLSGLSIMDEVLSDDRAWRIENLILGMQREEPGRYARVEVLAFDGIVIASTDIERIGARRSTSALNRIMTGAGGFWLGPYPVSGESSEPTIAVAHPIGSRLRDEPIGWLVGDAAWQRIAETVSEAKIGGRPQDASVFLTLLDASGRLLAGEPSLIERLPDVIALGEVVGEEIETRELGAAGTYSVSGHALSIGEGDPESALRIVAVWKSDVARRAVSGFVRAVLGSAAFGLALAAGASFIIARNLTQRIGGLSAGTNRISKGELEFRVREAGGDELEDLARSFNSMSQRLTEVRAQRARLQREILEISETERQRMGQDLHDGLGQVLTGAALLARGLETKLRAAQVPRTAEVGDAGVIVDLINDAIGQTRSLARGLFPAILEQVGLCGALEDLAAATQMVAPVECALASVGSPVEPPERLTALYLYRIAQEAVSNALKHGQPSKIEIILTREGRNGLLTIKDDGSGLPSPCEYGMGLRLMRYRAAVIGAVLHFEGRPGQGTEVSCRFDVTPAEA